MPYNSYKEWTEEEIRTMETLFQNDIPNEDIARVLDRTPRAVEHALKNLLIQEALHSNACTVSKKYNMNKETLFRELAPEKYYLDKKKGGDACIYVIAAFLLYMVVVIIGMYVDPNDTI